MKKLERDEMKKLRGGLFDGGGSGEGPGARCNAITDCGSGNDHKCTEIDENCICGVTATTTDARCYWTG